MSLPLPDDVARAHSEKVIAHLRAILAEEGTISFARYMAEVLYAPGLGYYSAGAKKFGGSGDFITASHVSPLFALCIAKQAREVLENLREPCVIEIGAGTGQFAVDFLTHCLPDVYYILEVSADLRERQQRLLAIHHPDKNIQWLDRLPDVPLQGLIFANEVLDAMPVTCFSCKNSQIFERRVIWQDKQFSWCEVPADAKLVEEIKHQCLQREEYYSELNRWITPWMQSLYDTLECGAILLIDYGFPESVYYHSERNQGTLMCHYRHHAHTNPFLYPGLQDITAHVNFTAVAAAAEQAGFELAGFSTQAAFLLALGIESMVSAESMETRIKMSKDIQTLIFPHKMGEVFKVMALEKNLSLEWQGFSLKEDSHTL